MDLRDWQREALQGYKESTETTYLVDALPAAGKTRMAAAIMDYEYRRNPNVFFIVVVPRKGLRAQWADEVGKWTDIYLDPKVENTKGDIQAGANGIVVTYHSVDREPEMYEDFCRREQVIVVLDETHHCGEAEHLSWGTSVSKAFSPAKRRLLITGTPVRRDGKPLSFLCYEGEPPVAVANYTYPWWMGLRDRIIRPIEFNFFDGQGRWLNAGEIKKSSLSEAKHTDEGVVLRSVLMSESEWVSKTFPEAAEGMNSVRRHIHDAGGLIIAKDQQGHAQALARVMSQITGRPVPYAVSDDSNAQDIIQRFINGDDPWLVAVNMISEGIDIPRLIMEIYATTIRTEAAWRQFMGRVIRTRSDTYRHGRYSEYNRLAARVFMPAIPTFIKFADKIEEEQRIALRPERPPTNGGDGGDGGEEMVPREALPADDAWYHSARMSGEEYSESEILEAARLADQIGVVGTPAQIAELLRNAQDGGTTPTEEGGDAGDRRPHWREDDQLKKDVNRVARRKAFDRAAVAGRDPTQEDFQAVFSELYRRGNITNISQADTEMLRSFLRWLSEM